MKQTATLAAVVAAALCNAPLFAQERVMINPVPDDVLLASSSEVDIHTPLGRLQDINEKLDKIANKQGVDDTKIAESVAVKIKEQIKQDVAEVAREAAKETVKGAASGAAQNGFMVALWAFAGVFAGMILASVFKGIGSFVSKLVRIAGKVSETIKEEANIKE